MTYKELGQLIQKRRKNLGMTQIELGRLAEVSFRTIQNEQEDLIKRKLT